jgi:glycosyltransferase involved in cell wall biosynthesis
VVRLHSGARQLFPETGQGRALLGADGRLAARLEEWSARRACVVTGTRSILEEVTPRLRLDPDGVRAIPPPVRLPELAPSAAGAPPRVLFVGRLEPRKAPETIVRAAPGVLEAVPEARFSFVGRDGTTPGARSSGAWLEGEATRLGVAHAIELLGPRDQNGVRRALQDATVCAFPSRWESFGLALAEASAVGRPVVASDIPAFRELVRRGETGELVAPDGVGAWAEALITLLTDPVRARGMGEAGADHVRTVSDPGRVADATLAAYEHAIRRRRDRRPGRRHM